MTAASVEDKLRQSILAIRALKREVEDLRAGRKPAIAVAGMACRLPGGIADPQGLWQLLCEGREAVTDVPPERWDVARWYDPDPDAPGKSTTRRGAFLRDVDQFDAGFFEIAAREAAAMDPQQRLLLECAWEALEDACLAPATLAAGSTGVYIGINGSDYHQMAMRSPATLDAHALSGTVSSVAAGRIAYALGLNGPAMAIDTACSSSLTAVHLAVQALRSGEIDAALVGGVYTVLEPQLTVALSKFHMLAPDGRCKAFDAAADGFVQGEGCVVLLLQRADDAQRGGRRVHALIRGSAANQDGRTSSLTAPSRSAQTAVVRAALKDAGIAPAQLGLVETHGTGTALGDPIEFDALAQALDGPRAAPVVLGALKTNLGHLGPAAGIAGLLKAVLAVREGEIPPNLHLRALNPAIDASRLDAVFPQHRLPWPALPGPRTAGASSFGFSGTNVHVVVQQWQPTDAPADAAAPGPVVLAVSGRSEAACLAARDRLCAVLGDGALLAAMARTSLLGRRQFEFRLAVVAASAHEARAALASAPVRAQEAARLAVWWQGGRGAALEIFDRLRAHHAALVAAGVAPVLHAGTGVGAWAALAAAGLAGWEAARQALAAAAGGAPWPGVAALLQPVPGAAPAVCLLGPQAVAVRAVDAMLAPVLQEALARGDVPAPQLPAALREQGATLLLRVGEPSGATDSGTLPQVHWDGDTAPPGRLRCLAALHCHGAAVDWARVLPAGPLAPLPAYPFQRRRHWRAAEPADAPVQALAPPWLPGERVAAPAGAAACFALRLSLAAVPWLADHRVHGQVVVPGAFQLLCLAAAWQALQGGAGCHMRALTFGRPLVVPADGVLVLHTVVEATGAARLASADGAVLYASAMLAAAGPATAEDAWPTLPAGEPLALPEWRARLAAMGIAIGPAFQGLHALHCAAGAAQGQVRLPAGLASGAGWHPALLDACLQVAGGALSAQAQAAGALLPIGIDDLTLWPAPADAAAVRARGHWQGEVFSSDIEARSGAGAPCLRLRGLHVRRAPAERLAGAAMPSLQALRWDAAPLADGAGPRRLLVTLPPQVPGSAADQWIAALQADGAELAVGAPGALDTPAADRDAVVALLAPAAQADGDGALWLARLALQLAAQPAPPPLVVATRGAWTADAAPGQAAAWAMALTASLECPHLRIHCVDADTPQALAAELRGGLPDEWVCRNAAGRRTPRLAAVEAGSAAPVRLRATVLVTGALGGLGRHAARWAVEQGAEHLLLTTRRAPDADAQAFLATLGVPVTVWQGDLAEPGAVARLVAAAPGGAPVRAVLHAAGAQAPGVLAALTPERFATAWAAKAGAAWALHRQTRGQPLDAFVLFSSVASLLGAAGQGGYAPANAALDALARHRQAEGLPATSVQWGAWAGAGMLAQVGEARQRQIADLGLRPMQPADALQALTRAVASGLPNVVVADADWTRLAAQHRPGRPLAWLGTPQQPATATPGAPQADPLDWLLAALRAVLRMPADEALDADRALVRLGLDSLMAVELRERIQRERGAVLSVAPLLSGSSAREVAQLLAEAAPQPAALPADDWEEFKL